MTKQQEGEWGTEEMAGGGRGHFTHPFTVLTSYCLQTSYKFLYCPRWSIVKFEFFGEGKRGGSRDFGRKPGLVTNQM